MCIGRRGAGHSPPAAEAAIGLDLGQPELAAFPGHAGLLPLHPGQLPPARAEGRVATEIHRAVQGLGLAAQQRHRHQLILAARFQYADPAIAGWIDQAATERSREAPIASGRGEPLRLLIALAEGELPQAAIALVHEHGHGLTAGKLADRAGSTAVFMHPAAQVPEPWRELLRRLIGPAARHQRGAALLLGPLLQPIENPAEQLRFPKARGLAQHQLSGQGGRAGAHRSHSGMAPRIA